MNKFVPHNRYVLIERVEEEQEKSQVLVPDDYIKEEPHGLYLCPGTVSAPPVQDLWWQLRTPWFRKLMLLMTSTWLFWKIIYLGQ